jgi:outer membrane lipoprotein carrier protein
MTRLALMTRPRRHALALAVALAGAVACASQSRPSFAQTPPAAAVPPTVDQAVANVQNFYNQSTTFESDFQQQFTVKAYNQTKSSDGHVTFSKPGKMNWVYNTPAGNRVVSDGQTIKVYQASDHQMYESPVNTSQYPAALSFLTGQGSLSSSFTFTLVPGDGEMKFPGGYILVGVPLQPTPAYSKVLFYVDSGTSQVRRVMIIDGQGNRNRFDFVNPRVNGTIAAGAFTFTPPPGTSVIHP